MERSGHHHPLWRTDHAIPVHRHLLPPGHHLDSAQQRPRNHHSLRPLHRAHPGLHPADRARRRNPHRGRSNRRHLGRHPSAAGRGSRQPGHHHPLRLLRNSAVRGHRHQRLQPGRYLVHQPRRNRLHLATGPLSGALALLHHFARNGHRHRHQRPGPHPVRIRHGDPQSPHRLAPILQFLRGIP